VALLQQQLKEAREEGDKAKAQAARALTLAGRSVDRGSDKSAPQRSARGYGVLVSPEVRLVAARAEASRPRQ